MQKEYDFTTAEQGKFYKKSQHLEIPIYLDAKIQDFFLKTAQAKNISLQKVVNKILKKDMAIFQEINS